MMDAAMGLFLAIFGCSDDMAMCERIQVAPTTYASASNCYLQQPIALQSKEAMSANYPNVIAICTTGKQLASMNGKTVDLSKPL